MSNIYLTDCEAAQLLGVKRRTIRLWRRTRGLPHIRLTKKIVRIPLDELKAWASQQRVIST